MCQPPIHTPSVLFAGTSALPDLDFTEASEFARSIQLQEAEEPQGAGRSAHKGRERPPMEDDDEAAPTPAAPKRRKKWVWMWLL